MVTQEVLAQNQVRTQKIIDQIKENEKDRLSQQAMIKLKNKRNENIANSVAIAASIAAGLLLVVGGAYLYYTHKDSGGDLDETEVSFKI